MLFFVNDITWFVCLFQYDFEKEKKAEQEQKKAELKALEDKWNVRLEYIYTIETLNEI